MLADSTYDLLAGLATLRPELGRREASAVLDAVRRDPSLVARVARSLAEAPSRAAEPGWETLAEAHGCTLQLFVWPTGARTPVHDHTSWGGYACLSGRLGEDRFVRVDDELRAGAADIRLHWRAIWRAGERSTVGPHSQGIHRVYNAGLRPAVSLHLYGPRVGDFDGRDYDVARAAVCDRLPDADRRWRIASQAHAILR